MRWDVTGSCLDARRSRVGGNYQASAVIKSFVVWLDEKWTQG